VVAVSRRPTADKFEQRREQLAASALTTLGELGYARTSLREVANNSDFSHGVLHYYFADKLELIIYSVRYYKALCVHRYDDVVDGSHTAPALLDAFADKLVETILEEAPMHRLWYDLRCQAMFQEGLREAVLGIDKSLEEMVWRVVTRYSDLTGRPPAMTPTAAYGVLDGLFQQALLGHVTGDDGALERLADQVHRLLPLTLAPAEGLQDA
jgi:AcrR family transcriptional regulator